MRCYYPDARVVRVEPRTIRNVFPSLSVEQQNALAQYYDFRKAESARIAGYDAQAWVFEPKDGLRYGHKFWAENSTGLLLKARVLGERGEIVEQFAIVRWSSRHGHRRRPTGRCVKAAPARRRRATPAGW